MVEFAIILPLLLLILYGVTELGRALYYQNTLYKALIAGSRYMARTSEIVDTETCTTQDGYSAAVTQASALIQANATLFPNLTFSTAEEGDPPPLPGEESDVYIIAPIKKDLGDDVIGCRIRIIADATFEPLFVPVTFGDNEFGAFNIHAEVEERYIGL